MQPGVTAMGLHSHPALDFATQEGRKAELI